ncbi:MAG: transporter substrate-binding domain-containing protein [Deltaproteobacteria bacterium]|nr:transporter substrate-binding domain-containing protein [Deltaproteobacteria bacterium]
MKKCFLVTLLVLLMSLSAVVTAPAGPIIDRILQRGELVVGTAGNMPPLNATSKDGKVIGFEADIARFMAGGMGVKLKMATMDFARLLPSLKAGKIDMIISAMTITPQRNLKVAFVGPYFISGKGILTRYETMASIDDAAKLNSPDKTLAALEGSTSQLFVERVISKAKLVKAKTYDEALDLVLKGKVDALIADYPYCTLSAYRYRQQGLVTVNKPFTYEPLGIALPPNDPLLVNWVQNSLRTLEGSGELRRLQKRWFEDASWLKDLP